VAVLHSTPSAAAAGGAVTALALAPSGALLLTGHAGGGVGLWHVGLAAAGALAEPRGGGGGGGGGGAPAPLPAAHSTLSRGALTPLFGGFRTTSGAARGACAVWALDFHPLAPSVFASGGRDGCAYIWSTGASEPLRVCAGHGGDVAALKWHPNGLYLVTGGAEGAVRVWDGGSGDCVRALLGGVGEAVAEVAVAPAGRLVAAGDARGGVRLWDVNSGALMAAWRAGAPGAPVHALAFTADGRALVSAAPAEEAAHAGGGGGSAGGSGGGGACLLCVWNVAATSQQRPATTAKLPGAVAFKLAHAGGGGLLLVGAKEK
jgi:WD40 repeat protein